MGGIIDKITEFIKELLQGWVLTNFETMFTDVNDKVGTIAGEVSKTPSTWNSGIFDMIKALSDNVMIPIAGMIISFVLVYELISMVIDKNNLHDFNTAIFIRFFIKACIAAMLLSKTFDIVMAVFDVGSHIDNSAAAAISGETSTDVSSTLQTMFNEQFLEMSIGELLGLGMETMIVSLCMKIMSVLITVILYGRMIEIYLYVSVAPVPCATVTNREWGTIGTNYFKGLCALAFQGFFTKRFRTATDKTFFIQRTEEMYLAALSSKDFPLISYPLALIKSKKSSYVEADLMQKLMSLLSWVFQVEPFCSDCHSLYFLPRSPPGMMMEGLCSLHSSSLSFRMW